MAVLITGQENEYIRVLTGLWSFDRLVASRRAVGFPMRTVTELYGPAGHGKSTIAEFLAGTIAKTGVVNVCDLESASEHDHMQATFDHAGFDGEVHMIEALDKDGKSRTHEDMLQETIDSLWKDEVKAIIIDSLGMVTPLAERNNPLGSANMGQRAKLIAQASRRMLNPLRNTKEGKVVFAVNHQYSVMGGMGKLTPGGDSKGYLAANRIAIWRKEILPDGSTLVECKVDKLRYGGIVPKRKGYIYIIPGYGVSPEMTSVFDCFIAGIAERKTTVKLEIDGKMTSMGRLNTLIDKACAGEKDIFVPFQQALTNNEGDILHLLEAVDEEEGMPDED